MICDRPLFLGFTKHYTLIGVVSYFENDKFITRFKREGIIVREGRTQRLKIKDSFIYKQKGVDMYLGMDMVSVPFEYKNPLCKTY